MNYGVILCSLMSLFFLILGFIFAVLKEKATCLISGFNFKSKEERSNYNLKQMSLDHRNLFAFWALLFFIGSILSLLFSPIFSILTFGLWLVLFFKEVHFDDEKAFGKYKLKE